MPSRARWDENQKSSLVCSRQAQWYPVETFYNTFHLPDSRPPGEMASRLTTNQEIAGSTPAVVIIFFHLKKIIMYYSMYCVACRSLLRLFSITDNGRTLKCRKVHTSRCVLCCDTCPCSTIHHVSPLDIHLFSKEWRSTERFDISTPENIALISSNFVSPIFLSS